VRRVVVEAARKTIRNTNNGVERGVVEMTDSKEIVIQVRRA
jgi:hypothetical protein